MAKVSGAVIVELLGNRGDPVRFTVNNANSITKGDLLFLFDARTASGANLLGNPACGVAAADKEVGDGSTSISVYTNGLFDLVGGTGGFAAGAFVRISGGNYVVGMTQDQFMSGQALGRALETASAEEYVVVKVGGLL